MTCTAAQQEEARCSIRGPYFIPQSTSSLTHAGPAPRISGLYEARRKNAQLTRYRIQPPGGTYAHRRGPGTLVEPAGLRQALNVKLEAVPRLHEDRAIQCCKTC